MTLTNATVLVVDDEPLLLQGYTGWLKRGGCKRVLSAANGLEALHLFLEHPIDLVISDLRMPVLDGPGLLDNIHRSGKALPAVIFVSGFSNVDSALARARGVCAILPKPFSSTVLLETAAKSLAGRDDLPVVPLQDVAAAEARCKEVVVAALEETPLMRASAPPVVRPLPSV